MLFADVQSDATVVSALIAAIAVVLGAAISGFVLLRTKSRESDEEAAADRALADIQGREQRLAETQQALDAQTRLIERLHEDNERLCARNTAFERELTRLTNRNAILETENKRLHKQTSKGE
jgi:cell shape-determining protein MreC